MSESRTLKEKSCRGVSEIVSLIEMLDRNAKALSTQKSVNQ